MTLLKCSQKISRMVKGTKLGPDVEHRRVRIQVGKQEQIKLDGLSTSNYGWPVKTDVTCT